MIKQLMGSVALSQFRMQTLLKQCQTICARITEISVHFVHLVELEHSLSTAEEEILTQLLHYGSTRSVKSLTGTSYFVVPRFGTQSPWSSKATDIARNCELTAVKRIERGQYYVLAHTQQPTLTEKQALQNILYDPLTQIILDGDNAGFSIRNIA